jgi:hypothetical protein
MTSVGAYASDADKTFKGFRKQAALTKLNSMALVRKRTIPTELLPLVG